MAVCMVVTNSPASFRSVGLGSKSTPTLTRKSRVGVARSVNALGYAAITATNKTAPGEARGTSTTGADAPPPSSPKSQATPISRSVCIHPRPPRTAPLKKRPVKVRARAAHRKLLILSQPFSYPDPTQSEKGDAFDVLVAKLRLLELETKEFETLAKKSNASRSRPTSGSRAIAKTPAAINRRLSQQLSRNEQRPISACLYHTSSVPVLNHSPPPSVCPPQSRKLIKSSQSTTTASSPDLISASLSSLTEMRVSIPPPPSVPGPFPSRNSPDADHLRHGDTPQPSPEQGITVGPSPVHHSDHRHHDSSPLTDVYLSDPDDMLPTPQATTSTSSLRQTAILGNERLTSTTGSQVSTSATDISSGRLTRTKSQANTYTDRKSTQGRSRRSSYSQSRGAKSLVFTSIVRPCTPRPQRDSGSVRSHSS